MYAAPSRESRLLPFQRQALIEAIAAWKKVAVLSERIVEEPCESNGKQCTHLPSATKLKAQD